MPVKTVLGKENCMKKITKQRLLFAAAVLLFSVICCLTNIISGDDYLGYYSREDSAVSYIAGISGRYFSNLIAYPIIRYPAARFCLYVPILFLCIWLLADCVQIKEKRIGISWLALGLFCTMVPEMFAQVLMWLGAFAPYVPPMIFAMLFLRTVFHEFAGKPVKSKWAVPCFAAVGFAGALCTEHMAIYACCLSVFVLLYAFFRKDLKLRAYQIAYAAGTAAGTVLLFLNPNYSAVANGTEEHTYRFIESSPLDIMMQLYMKVIVFYSQRLWILNFLIAASLLLLYRRADRSGWKPDKCRFAKAALTIAFLFPLYFCINYGYVRLESIDGAMRLSALETAFSFLHLISVLYLGVILCKRQSGLRLTVFLVSTVICTAPFCMANPVSQRCFFSTFCFWVLAALEICTQAVCALDGETAGYCRRGAFLLGAVMAGYLSYINILNFVTFRINVSEVRAQLAESPNRAVLIDEPYMRYTPSFFFNTVFDKLDEYASGSKEDYLTCMLRYHGIPKEQVDPEKLVVTHQSLYDYLL